MVSVKEHDAVERAEQQEPVTTPVRRPATRKKIKTEEPGYRVYVGPSIRGRVQYGAVFSSASEARKELKREFGDFPAFGIFLVTGQQLPQARIDVKTPGTALYTQAKRLRVELNKLK